jgi:peroxiredoxin Q/BCP
MIEEGSQFPEFSLPDQDGNLVSLADLRGKRAVIYFYPKDDTTGCTAEACEFRDIVPNVPDARVVGVSPDSAKSHRKFVDKYGLNFTLLADEGHKLADELGLWVEKSMYGKTYMGVERTTFVLDPNGKIEKIYRKVKPQGHAAAVIEALE